MPEEIKIPEYLTYDQWVVSFKDEEVVCEECHGKKKSQYDCPQCDGTGYIESTCETCRGKGITNGKGRLNYNKQFLRDKEKWEEWHRILQEAANAGA